MGVLLHIVIERVSSHCIECCSRGKLGCDVTTVITSCMPQYINSVHHNIRASCVNLIGHVIPASSDQPSLVAMVLHCLADGDYRVRRAALEAMVTIYFRHAVI